jgi:hypothetical protein
MFGSTLLVNRPRRVIALSAAMAVVALAAPGLAHAQATRPVPAGEPAKFLQKYIGLSAGDIEKARQGQVVTKVLDTKDNDEVALFGIVAIDASRDDVIRRVKDLPSFLRQPGRSAFGLFSTPATEADMKAFVVESSDLDALKKCKPTECDVKMPSANISDLTKIGDMGSPAARAQVESYVRQRSAVYVNNYRKGGTAAMVAYGDQKQTRSAADAFTALLAQSPYLFDYVPAFREYLQAYPGGSLPTVTDAIYWASDKMGSLRPILSINHLSIFTPPGSPMTLVSNKQLYASHYFLGAFTLTTLLDRPETPGKGTYYIVVQRLRFDHLPSGGLFNIRGRVIGKVHDGLRDDLTARKASLEGR